MRGWFYNVLNPEKLLFLQLSATESLISIKSQHQSPDSKPQLYRSDHKVKKTEIRL